MKHLVSGMMLVEKKNGSLHYLMDTQYGFKAIDTKGHCIEFIKENYEKAYIPTSYNGHWDVVEGTEIIFDNNFKDNIVHSFKNGHRTNCGSNNPKSKLTEYDVVEIRCLYNNNVMTIQGIATKYGTSWTTISNVVKHNTWKHI